MFVEMIFFSPIFGTTILFFETVKRFETAKTVSYPQYSICKMFHAPNRIHQAGLTGS